MPKTRASYRSWQMEKLSDPAIAAAYLNACLDESPQTFLSGLKKVAQARQMTAVAKEAGIQRETLYRSISEQGNPTLETLSSVLAVLGMELRVTVGKQNHSE
jgi:probable addiction module antidote protein